MKKNKINPKCTDTLHTHGYVCSIKEKIYVIALVTIIIIILACSWFFNRKLNLMNSKILLKIGQINNVENLDKSTPKYNYKNLLSCQENYNPLKQYFDYTGNINKFSNVIKDENGVRLIDRNQELIYNPVSIAQYGLNQYSNYIEYGDKEYLDNALIQAEYLYKIQDKENGKFYYNFDFAVSGTDETLYAPWASAMAQGQIISLFVRIYNETKDEKYMKSSELALKPLTITVEKGGLQASLFGHKYYEEYPTQNPSYTLNGFMFTLIGIYDFYYLTDNELAKELYFDGMETLEFCLPLYDYDGISLYHLAYMWNENLTEHYSERYHLIHIIELKTLNQTYNSEIINYYIDKWEKYTGQV